MALTYHNAPGVRESESVTNTLDHSEINRERLLKSLQSRVTKNFREKRQIFMMLYWQNPKDKWKERFISSIRLNDDISTSDLYRVVEDSGPFVTKFGANISTKYRFGLWWYNESSSKDAFLEESDQSLGKSFFDDDNDNDIRIRPGFCSNDNRMVSVTIRYIR